MNGRMDFEFGFKNASASPRGRTDEPMRILLLGDFSGRAAGNQLQPEIALAKRPVVAVDIDNFDDVMARFSPQVRLPIDAPGSDTPGSGGAPVGEFALQFKDLDDFHPDDLYQKLDVFHGLYIERIGHRYRQRIAYLIYRYKAVLFRDSSGDKLDDLAVDIIPFQGKIRKAVLHGYGLRDLFFCGITEPNEYLPYKAAFLLMQLEGFIELFLIDGALLYQ